MSGWVIAPLVLSGFATGFSTCALLFVFVLRRRLADIRQLRAQLIEKIDFWEAQSEAERGLRIVGVAGPEIIATSASPLSPKTGEGGPDHVA